MKLILVIILFLIQLPFVIEGWISNFLNLIVKMLSSIIFPLAIISLIWWPLDMLCSICWAGCECLKHKILGNDIEFSTALGMYAQIYPEV